MPRGFPVPIEVMHSMTTPKKMLMLSWSSKKMPHKSNLQTIAQLMYEYTHVFLKEFLEAQWLFIYIEVRHAKGPPRSKAIIFEVFFFEGSYVTESSTY